MKILYVLRPNLGSLPPVISQINALCELGHEITFLTTSLNAEDKSVLKNYKINTIVSSESNSLSLLSKILSLIKFKRKLAWACNHCDYDLIWIGSGDTAKYGRNVFLKCPKFVLNLYELYDQDMAFLKKIKKVSNKALSIVVPEYCRANILKVWLNLKKRPIVIPNAPFYFNSTISSETESIVSMLSNLHKKIILYQGWIGGQRSVASVAEALAGLNDNGYCLVLMGKCGSADAIEILEKKFSNVVHINHLSPPQHLFITKMAFMGIATYDDSSLNNVFCAPNKIYEYANFGVPILARDIPGLKYVIEENDAGVCVDMNNVESIQKAISFIDQNHKRFSNGSKMLFSKVDIKNTISSILLEIEK